MTLAPPESALSGSARYAVRGGVLYRRRPRPGLIAGTAVLGLAAAAAGQLLVIGPNVESRLRDAAASRLAEAGFPDVAVSVDGRDVELSRVGADPATIAQVAAIVREVPGVRTVRRIEVNAGVVAPPAATPTGSTLPSPEPSKGPAAIASPPAPLADLATIGAVLDGGQVVLLGTVPSQAARARLVAALGQGFDPARITDRLTVDDASGAYGLDGFVRVLLHLGPQTRAGAMSLRTGRMTVAGVVTDGTVTERIRRDAAEAVGADPASLVTNLVVGTPGAPITPGQVADQLSALPPIGFAGREADLLPQALPVIAAATQLLDVNPVVTVRVEGHTDARGEADLNLDLSRTRAAAVVRALQEAGVDPDRLSASGYGETRPLAAGQGEQVDALNRRVVLVGVAPRSGNVSPTASQ